MNRTLARALRVSVALMIVATFLTINHVRPIFGAGCTATLSGSTFEGADGNLTPDCSTDTDWNSPPPNYKLLSDTSGSSADNGFGVGTKEDSVNPTVVFQKADSKNDLTGMRIGYEVNKVNGHVYVYAAWNRLKVTGAANEDFEFNQSTAGTGGSTTSGSGGLVLPLPRTNGDVLIQYNFSGSGTPTMTVWQWAANTTAPPNGYYANGCLVSADVPPCWSNGRSLTGTSAIAGVSADGSLGEAAVDFTAAGIFNGTTCENLGSAYAKGRSSSSASAELKDFVAPQSVHISNCAQVKISKTGKAANGTTSALAGATFGLWSGSTVNSSNLSSPITTCTTGTDGSCTFTGGPNAGLFFPGTYTVEEISAPTGYALDPTPQTVNLVADEIRTLNFVDNKVGTQLTVKATDTMTGLPSSAGGTITYQYYTTTACSGTPVATGGGTKTAGVATTPTSTTVTLPSGDSNLYFTASFSGTLVPGGKTQTFTTPCDLETVSVHNG